MALLNQSQLRCTWLAAAAWACAGCTAATSGHVEVSVADCAAHSCDAVATSAALSLQHFNQPALIDASASRFAPHGLYVYFELERGDGTLATIEFDVPTGTAGSVEQYDASYRELRGDRVVFESHRMQGLIIPPPSTGGTAGTCGCDQGRFELRFVDEGPDGALGTSDDAERELRQGRLGSSEDWCAAPAPLAMSDALQVQAASCPPAPSVASTQPPMTNPQQGASGARAPTQTVVRYEHTESIGCGGSATTTNNWDDSGSSAGSDGCGSSASSPPSDEDNGGACEGDRYDGDDSSCQSDHDDSQSSACAVAARPSRRPHFRAGYGALQGLGLPLLVTYLTLARRARRARRPEA